MKKITDIFKEKEKTFSFELFPPKTEKGYDNLLKTLESLIKLNPDFFSCTYGAGGGNREQTFNIAQLIQDKYNIPCMAHLTCVLNTKDQIREILQNVKERNIRNILALRGDPPLDNPDWRPTDDNFIYSSKLCAFIRREHQDYFCIGVAGFPEGHILCQNRDLDAQFLKSKIKNGADFVISQFFFDNDDYFSYVERLRKIGVPNRVIPGILPITSYQGLLKFTQMNGSKITKEVKDTFEPIQDDPDATLKHGIDFAIRQCQSLLKGGAPGLHFYSLNRAHPTDTILNAVRPSS